MVKFTCQTKQVQIILADPHAVFRRELHKALDSEAGFCVAGEAETAIQAMALAQQTQPYLALVDMRLNDILGAIVGIHQLAPQARLVLLTLNEDQEDVVEMLKSGVSAQINKDAPLEQIIANLKAVCRGEVFVSPSLTGVLLKKFRQLSQTLD